MNQIGRYQIVRELGRGAMGVVFEARDPLIGRTVALKMIRLDAFGTPDEREWLQERLFREARSAGALSHPGIVVIYDLGTGDGLTYIAMEFVEGPTLEQLLATSAPFPWNDAMSIARQMAEALDHAHAAGVVHRDVKPANVMLQRGKIVKITDFGIAKITSTQQLTRTGTTMGTPSYMSPEQITAKAVDGRADQFSLAVVAYQILTGVKPFQGESLPNLVYQIVYEERPSARSVNGALPIAVDDVLRRGLSRLPEDRYHSCVAFVDALEAALAVSPNPVMVAPQPAADPEKQQSEFTALFGEFIETRRQQERAAKLDSAVQEVDALVALGEMDAAASALTEARREFGDEPVLLQAGSRLDAARQKLVDGAVNRAREWLETRNFPAALNVLEIAGAEHGESAKIAELRAQVVREQAAEAARREYEAELEKALDHARALLARDAPGEAVQYLDTVAARYGQEGEFTRLVEDATAARKSSEARAKLDACISSVDRFLAAGNWKAARSALAYTRNDFPGEPALAAVELRIEQVRQAELRESQPRAEVAPISPSATVAEPPARSKGLLVGASTAVAVIVALLLVKVFSSSSPHTPPPQAAVTEPAKAAAPPETALPAPRITQFYASPPHPVKGQKTLVCYGVENASEVSIDPPLDRVWPAATRCLEVIPSRTVTYTLTAVRGSEKVSKSLTVQIGAPPVKIIELSINKLKVAPGELITACYKVTNASRVVLSPGVVSSPYSNESGCVSDHPQKTTTYTLTARGAGGSVDTERVTVTVAATEKIATPPKIDEPARPKAGSIIWTGALAPGSDLNIDGGSASAGSLTGALPGVPVTVAIHPDTLKVTTAPDAGNGWKRLTIHNAGGTAQSIISIKWAVR